MKAEINFCKCCVVRGFGSSDFFDLIQCNGSGFIETLKPLDFCVKLFSLLSFGMTLLLSIEQGIVGLNDL